MKNYCTFVEVSDQGTNYIEFAMGYFVSICLLISAKIRGCSNPMFPLHSCSGSLVGNWEANGLSYLLSFSRTMTKELKNASKVNNSSLVSTLFHETETLSPALSMPEISKVLIQVCEHLGKKTELHVHFIINSVIVGNDMNNGNAQIGENINYSRTGHSTVGNESRIDGCITMEGGML